MDILNVLRSGTSNMKNPKFSNVSNSMRWRQKYLGADIYPIVLEDGRVLNIKQIENGETSGLGTGATVWAAAHVLSKYLEIRYSRNMQNMYVCDIGSGTGVTGLVAAALGAKVSLTDQECIFFLMKENKETICHDNTTTINSDNIQLSLYDWGKVPEDLNLPFDLVLVSDCVLPKLYPIEPLVQAVSDVIGEDSIALFSYEHRVYPTFDPRFEFERIATQYGLSKRVIPFAEHHPDYRCEDIEIWEITRRSNRQTNTTTSNNTATSSSSSFSSSSSSSTLPEDETNITHYNIAKNNANSHNNNLHHKISFKMYSWGSIPQVVAVYNHHYPIVINQDITSGAAIGTWLWPSAVVLSRYILTSYTASRNGRIVDNTKSSSSSNSLKVDIRNRPIALDLGAGCGLTTIALLISGYRVITADRSNVLPILRQNIETFCQQHYDLLRLEPLFEKTDVKHTIEIESSELDCGNINNINNNNNNNHIAPSAQAQYYDELYQIVDFDWSNEHSIETFFNNIYSSNTIANINSNGDDGNNNNAISKLSVKNISLIVCSDCVYNSASVQPLARILDKIIKANQIKTAYTNEKHQQQSPSPLLSVLVANEIRSPLEDFIRACASIGLCFQDVSSSSHLSEEESHEVYRGPISFENDPNRPVRLLLSSATVWGNYY